MRPPDRPSTYPSSTYPSSTYHSSTYAIGLFLALIAGLSGGCDKAKATPPPPEMFGAPAPPATLPSTPAAAPAPARSAPAGVADATAAAVDAEGQLDSSLGLHGEGAPLHPVDSLLVGPCPLAGEVASTCLRELERPVDRVRILHVLIAYKGTMPGAPPHRDARAAAKLALELGHAARTEGVDFVALMHRYSDDPGEGAYTIDATAEARFVPPFIIGARRLALGSVDVVRSRFGFHVMKRVPEDFVPAARPLAELIGGACPEEGEEAARCGVDRPVKPGFVAPKQVVVAHVLVAYKGAIGRRRVARDQASALALAVRVAHAARRAGADFKGLQKRYSDDPGSGQYDVSTASGLLPAFKRLALRLPLGGVDVVETRYGYHVVRRMK